MNTSSLIFRPDERIVERIDTNTLKVKHIRFGNTNIETNFYITSEDWKAIIDFLEIEGKDGTICF